MPKRGRRPPAKCWTVRLPGDYLWKLLDRLLDDLSPYADLATLLRFSWAIRSRSVQQLLAFSDEWDLQSIGSSQGTGNLVQDKIRYLLGSISKKFQFRESPWDREAQALATFVAAEHACSEFNRKGWKRLIRPDGRPSAFLGLMQAFCLSVLGPVPDFEGMARWMRHGPGATTGARGRFTSAYYKYRTLPYHVTAGASAYAKLLISTDERWVGALEEWYRKENGVEPWTILNQELFWGAILTPVTGNEVTFVPKTVKTHRSIAIEPTLNVFMQLGVDGWIRRRLKRWGINLDDQRRNMRLAREGSCAETHGSPVTLDLSSASDSVSLRLVKLLFPPDWYRLVCALRSPKGNIPGLGVKRYAKLSSMGNGYTFAVESLVFAAVAYAASMQYSGYYERDRISVYGDDIIVPKHLMLNVVAGLRDCGFTLNPEKSFSTGFRRESCGSDWVQGMNVRPVFLKEQPVSLPELLAHRNILFRWFQQHLGADCPIVDAFIESYLPHWIPKGPVSDHEFDTYWHTRTPGKFARWSYEVRRIHASPVAIPGCNELPFRKLMHPLRPRPAHRWDECPVGGSVFTVVVRKAKRYGIGQASYVPSWTYEYSPVDDVGSPVVGGLVS